VSLRLALALALFVALLPSTASAALPPGTFRSSIVVGNPGTTTAAVSLAFLRPAGTNAWTEMLSVPAGASRTVYVPNIANLPDGRYTLRTTSDQYVTIVVNLASDDASTATAYRAAGTTSVIGRTLYLPHAFADSGGYTTAIVLSNGGNATATTYSIAYKDRDGNTVGTASGSLPGFGSALVDSAAVAGIGSGNRAAVVTASDDITAVVLTYLASGDRLGAARGRVSGGTSLFFPVAHKAYFGYNTTLFMQNTAAETSNVRVTQYDQRGQAVITYSSTTPVGSGGPTGVSHGSMPELPNGFNGAALAVSPESRQLVGIGSILHERNYETYEAATGASTRATCPAILKNYFGYNTSLTVQNIGAQATDLTLQYVDRDGRQVAQQSLAGLASGAIFFNYTPSTAELPDGFNGQVTVTSSGQAILAIVNEQLGVGDQPGDQLFSYGCDNGVTATGTTYSSFAPLILKNAPIG
jgi:hypothetical protein